MTDTSLTAEDEPVYLAFASYKGGVGRTLAAASCATALARGGFHVLMIDFDVEAPGLPTFFGIDSFVEWDGPHDEDEADEKTAEDGERRPRPRPFDPDLPRMLPAKCGLVFWAVDRRQDRRQHDLGPVVPFIQHLMPLEVDGPGSLRLLPAGPVGRDYLGCLRSHRWQAWIRPRDTEEPWARKRVENLKAAIRDLDPRPDYVIVDTTAGFDAAAYRVLDDLADDVVFLVTNEPGEPVVVDDMRGSFAMDRFHVVLSRVPTVLKDADRYLEQSRWSDAKNLPMLRYDPYFGLSNLTPSVPATGDTFESAIDGSRTTEPHQLTLDHLRLLRRLLPPSRLLGLDGRMPANADGDSALHEPVKSWMAKADQLPQDFYKLFTVFGGSIKNPSDPEAAANVSFRVESIQRMFNDVWANLPSGGVAGQKREDAFLAGGRHAGQGYGKSLAQWMENESADYLKTLQLWCREDSQVGFGEFRMGRFEPGSLSGEMTIYNAFLPPIVAEGNRREEVLYGGSFILEGYLRGVIEGLFPVDMRVTVIWKRLVQRSDSSVAPDVFSDDAPWDTAFITFAPASSTSHPPPPLTDPEGLFQ